MFKPGDKIRRVIEHTSSERNWIPVVGQIYTVHDFYDTIHLYLKEDPYKHTWNKKNFELIILKQRKLPKWF